MVGGGGQLYLEWPASYYWNRWTVIVGIRMCTTIEYACFIIQASYTSSPLFYNREYLYNEYFINQKSVTQVANQIECAHSSIVKHLAKFGIPTREEAPSHCHTGQLAYGTKLFRGRVAEVKFEQVIIKKMG